jgi:Flp pilus assembly protein TadG
VAAVELAVLVPFLVLIFVIGVDWSRIFYYSIIVDNAARNGAIWACDPYSTVKSTYPDITSAALADASDLNPTPSVTSATGTDASGNAYVECTVTYNFKTVSNFPLVPSSTTITRTVRMYSEVNVPR